MLIGTKKGSNASEVFLLYVRKYVRKSFVQKNKLIVERLEKGEEMHSLTKPNLTLEKLLKKRINSYAINPLPRIQHRHISLTKS